MEDNDQDRPLDLLSRRTTRVLVWQYLRENRTLIIAYVVVVLVLFPVESVVLPRCYSSLFESIRTNWKHLPSLLSRAAVWPASEANPAFMFYAIIALWALVIVLYLAKHSEEATIVPTYLSFVRQNMFSRTLEAHQENYKDLRIGDTITRIMDVSRNMKDILTWFLGEIVPIVVTSLCISLYLLWVNWQVGGLMLLGMVLQAVTLGVFGVECITLSARREKTFVEMNEKLHDSFGNLMNIYLNNMKNDEIEKNHGVERSHGALMNRQYIYSRNLVALLSCITIGVFFAAIVVVYQLLRSGTITPVIFVTIWIIMLHYLSYMMRLAGDLPHFLTKLGVIKNSKAFFDGIFRAGGAAGQDRRVRLGNIRFDKVDFAYDNRPVLRGFSAEIRRGEKVALMGKSGSGKTTAMKLLTRMYAPDAGVILIDGQPLEAYPLDHLRASINYINQRTSLFNDTVLRNITYGNDATEEQVYDMLARYELDSIYSNLAEGLMTSAGTNGTNLSHGMQKVTMILRGVLKGGRIIVLDEPLAGLDQRTRQRIMRLIAEEFREQTVIVITHDVEILPQLDRTIDMGEANGA